MQPTCQNSFKYLEEFYNFLFTGEINMRITNHPSLFTQAGWLLKDPLKVQMDNLIELLNIFEINNVAFLFNDIIQMTKNNSNKKLQDVFMKNLPNLTEQYRKTI